MTIGRFVVGLAMMLLLAWVWTSNRQMHRQWGNTAFAEAHTHRLVDAEGAALRAELGALLNAAGMKSPFAINETFRPERLNVYVTRSSQFRQTGCRPGDARYLPDDDVMLIDQGIVQPVFAVVGYSTVGLLAAERDNSAATTWRRFVLLHELGHRALHRSRLQRWKRSARDIEEEADSFAFEALARLPDAHTGSEHESVSGSTSVLSTTAASEVPAAERVLVRMATVIQDLSVTLLFSSAHFSTFYANSSHEAFAQRFRNRLDSALRNTTHRITETYLLLAREYLRRLEQVGERVTLEIQSPHPVAGVSADGDSLVVQALDQGATYAYRLSPSQSRDRLINLADHERDPGAAIAAPTAVTQIEVGQGVWRTIGQSDEPNRWELRNQEGGVIQRRLETDLFGALAQRFYLDAETLRQCVVEGAIPAVRGIHMSFRCRDDFYIATLLVPSLELAEIDGLLLPNTPASPAWVELIDLLVDGERRTYVLRDMLTDVHTRPYELQLWRVFSRGLPRLVFRQMLTMDWIPTGASMDNWFRIRHPPLVSCSMTAMPPVICTQYQDAVFALDPKSERLSVLFYPAGTEMLRLADGGFAFWAKGGVQGVRRKCSITHRQPEEPMMNTARVLVTVICVAIGFAGFWWLVPQEESFGMFESGAPASALRIGLSFGAVIVGVVLGSLYRALKYLADRGEVVIGDVRQFLFNSFRSVDMWLGLVAAPLVYAVLLQSADGMALSGLVVTGLQNGFCVLVVANALLEKRPPAAANPAP